MLSNKLTQLECHGNHFEMGLTQGEWVNQHLDDIFISLTQNNFVPHWIKMAGPGIFKALLTTKGLTLCGKYLKNLKKYAPLQFERFEGLVKGSKLNLPLALGMASIESMSAQLEYMAACTSMAISPQRSQEATPLLAYNHDFPGFLKDHLFIRRSKPLNYYESLQMTYPTLPGSICGLNSKGVALTLNHAFSTEPANDGVPPTLLVQEALDSCKNTQEVQALFQKTKFSNGSMVTVIDKTGKIMALELGRNCFGLRKPFKGMALTLNAYQLDELIEIEVPQNAQYHPKKFPDFFHGHFIHFHNWERKSRFDELLKQKKLFSIKDLKSFLKDHGKNKKGDLGTICRHHPTTDTIGSVILHPSKGMMEALVGYPCQEKYQKFAF